MRQRDCLSRGSRPCAKPCAGRRGCAGGRDPDDAGNLQHQFLLGLLFYPAVRVPELVNIRVGDVDQQNLHRQRKGDKDRYILFPDSFWPTLKAYLLAHPDNCHLFESRHRRP